jgi:hypothetical protein
VPGRSSGREPGAQAPGVASSEPERVQPGQNRRTAAGAAATDAGIDAGTVVVAILRTVRSGLADLGGVARYGCEQKPAPGEQDRHGGAAIRKVRWFPPKTAAAVRRCSDPTRGRTPDSATMCTAPIVLPATARGRPVLPAAEDPGAAERWPVRTRHAACGPDPANRGRQRKRVERLRLGRSVSPSQPWPYRPGSDLTVRMIGGACSWSRHGLSNTGGRLHLGHGQDDLREPSLPGPISGGDEGGNVCALRGSGTR